MIGFPGHGLPVTEFLVPAQYSKIHSFIHLAGLGVNISNLDTGLEADGSSAYGTEPQIGNFCDCALSSDSILGLVCSWYRYLGNSTGKVIGIPLKSTGTED